MAPKERDIAMVFQSYAPYPHMTVFQNIEYPLKIKNIQVNLLGDHNITNAAASIAIALNLGVKVSKIKKALKKFLGIQRRLTKIFSLGKREMR